MSPKPYSGMLLISLEAIHVFFLATSNTLRLNIPGDTAI